MATEMKEKVTKTAQIRKEKSPIHIRIGTQSQFWIEA